MFGLTKYRPQTPSMPAGIRNLEDEMERVFNAFFAPAREGDYNYTSWYPAVDLLEKEDKYILKAEIPGMTEKDIQISVEGNNITLKGEKKEEKEEKGRYQHRLERYYGSFYRTFQLPTNVNADKIEAHYKNGLLEIHVPKDVSSKAKNIEITV